jgi:N-formylglutamate amidohydrolase
MVLNAEKADAMAKSPIIIHIPHSSTYIPMHIRREMLLDDNELESELLKMTDRYVDELAEDLDGYVSLIKFQYSRLVADPERFRDESKEIMAPVGMAAVYSSTSEGKPLRHVKEDKKELLLKTYYDPYHQEFENKATEIINEFGKCLIIDLHSFPSKPLPYEFIQEEIRPDFCIGTDKYHTPKALVNFAENFFQKAGFSTKINEPFASTFVPLRFYQKDKRVNSIMIEINRSLYMDEKSGEKNSGFFKIRDLINEFIAEVKKGS